MASFPTPGLDLLSQGMSMFGKSMEGLQQRRAQKAEQEKLQGMLDITADGILKNPSAMGINPENAEIAAQIVRNAGKSQFAQIANVLFQGIFSTKTPGTFEAALLKGVDLMAQGERTGDERAKSAGMDLMTGVMESANKFMTMKESIKSSFKSAGKGGGGSKGDPRYKVGGALGRLWKLEKATESMQQEITKIDSQSTSDVASPKREKLGARLRETLQEMNRIKLNLEVGYQGLINRQQKLQEATMDPAEKARKRAEELSGKWQMDIAPRGY